MIISAKSGLSFVHDDNCKSGIVKTASKVKKDIETVLDAELNDSSEYKLVFGIAGESVLIDELAGKGLIIISHIIGKREVYGFFVLEQEKMIVVAGSDKRGAIYGLYHISDMIGISPLINWSGVIPPKQREIAFSAADSMISKEPSVTYRGFFINDEWPAFGTWCSKHFGGVNARMYEHVFELLLRMKGNYLWPAMWASCFACDGPGLEAAELADEYGVIMGLSHHEPCLRHGEEYSHLRGKDSIYGDAWDFRSNKEGITRFWEDGLKRNGHLENIITVGMRGERDSAILGENSGLADNIALLRDVLATQNRLIRENVNSDIDKVPRMLALYKEVEPYYYGNDTVEGLRNCSELDDVILMLCDDNHGYLRTLPDEEMRKHKGGFGMYYHFDYHGSPVSYEWINSSYLPTVWEQMTECYSHGVQKLWIVNVGDLGLNEMPLCYFMDLAYDYDRWSEPDLTDEYMKQWVDRQFGAYLKKDDVEKLAAAYTDYTRIMHNRRPEHMNEYIYGVCGFDEAWQIMERLRNITEVCREMGEKIPDEAQPAYTELISYSLLAGCNLVEMWINSGFNVYYARIGAVAANGFRDRVCLCLEKDEELKELLHSVGGRRFDGFGLAPHIGFRNWNSEESANPVLHSVIPVNRADIMVGLLCDEQETSGHEWTKRILEISHFAVKDGQRYAGFFAALMGTTPVSYTVECDRDWVMMNKISGTLTLESPLEQHIITIDETKMPTGEGIIKDTATVLLHYLNETVTIKVNAVSVPEPKKNVFYEENGLICVNAAHFSKNVPADGSRFEVIKELGRTGSAVKLMPAGAETGGELPYLEYSVFTADEGDYNIIFELAPNNPYRHGTNIELLYSVNDECSRDLSVVSPDYEAGVTEDWAEGVLEHIHYVYDEVHLQKGLNIIRFFGSARENVLEWLCLFRDGTKSPDSYLAPPESITL